MVETSWNCWNPEKCTTNRLWHQDLLFIAFMHKFTGFIIILQLGSSSAAPTPNLGTAVTLWWQRLEPLYLSSFEWQVLWIVWYPSCLSWGHMIDLHFYRKWEYQNIHRSTSKSAWHFAFIQYSFGTLRLCFIETSSKVSFKVFKWILRASAMQNPSGIT